MIEELGPNNGYIKVFEAKCMDTSMAEFLAASYIRAVVGPDVYGMDDKQVIDWANREGPFGVTIQAA